MKANTEIEFAQIVVFFIDKSTLRRLERIECKVCDSLCMIVLILDKICHTHPTTVSHEEGKKGDTDKQGHV